MAQKHSQKYTQDYPRLGREVREEAELARDWLAHVEAGRIGAGSSTTTRQLFRHMRNEEAVLGRACSGSCAGLDDYGRAGRL